MNHKMWTRATVALGVLRLLSGGEWGGPETAYAGVVQPGETVVVNAADFSTPQGPVLAQSILPFSIDYTASGIVGDFLEFPGSVDGTLTSTVVRDEKRGTLLFLYDVDLESNSARADASDASVLSVDGFESFKTNVNGALDFENVVLASRTKDGSSVKISSDDPGLGGPPRLVVRTDATDFAPTGTARFFAGDELAVRTPDGLMIELAGGTAVVSGTFQPVGSPPHLPRPPRPEPPPSPEPPPLPPPPPNPIPLPPAAWSGLLAVGTAMLPRAMRRIRARS